MFTGKNNTSQEILRAIKSSKNILLIMDSRFDYDALGSVLAFSDMLKQLKIKHRCIYGYEIPATPKEYFDTGRVEENIDLEILDYKPYDLITFLDTGTLEHSTKTQDYRAPVNKATLNIDHHAGNPLYGKLNYVQVKASTGSVLYDLFKEWKINITPEIANFLLAGQITDTGFLQYNNTDAKELQVVVDLVSRGARYFDFINHLTMNVDYKEMITRGIVYSNLKRDIKRKFAYSVLLKEEVKRRGAEGFDSINPAGLIRPLKDVDFVFVIKTDPLAPGAWYVSLRSHNMDYDVLRIAQKLNGGGHKVAAGCSIPLSYAKTVEEVVEKIWKVAEQNQQSA